MITKLHELIKMIGNPKLRQMVSELLSKPDISFNADRLSLEECPGGARVHHNYEGGLLQHTIAVAKIALDLCNHMEEIYGGDVDRDVVLAAALLHDIMKCYVYIPTDRGGFTSSPLGERIDHLTLLVAEMYRRGFSLEVIHAVASHHGERGPIRPRTIEALIVSIADLADSELSRRILRAAEYLALKATGVEARYASSKEALEVVRAKALKGWEGVRRLKSEEK